MNSLGDARTPRRAVMAATIGNGLEFYDFITFAFFAIQIGKTFFPSTDPFTSLMGSLATFGAGFLSRPLGAWIIGGWADRHGRKPAMLFSMTLMGCAIAVMALTPGYESIGMAAPIIVVLARLAQGFALGGEVGSATSYMMEAVPDHRRGASIAWQGGSQQIAGTIGALVGMVLSFMLADQQLTDYGWRIALLLGTMIVPFAILIRKTLPETVHAPEPVDEGIHLPGRYRRIVVLGMIMIGGGTIATYIFQYMATYGQNTLGLSPEVSLAAEFANNGVGLFAILLGGWLSDRIGRKPVMVWPNAAFILLIVPCYLWLTTQRDAVSFIGANVILSAVSSVPYGAVYAAISEGIPKAFRARSFALIYSLPVTILGGTTQLTITWILKVTGAPMSVAWYLAAVSTVSLVAMILMRESAPAKLAGVAGRM